MMGMKTHNPWGFLSAIVQRSSSVFLPKRMVPIPLGAQKVPARERVMMFIYRRA